MTYRVHITKAAERDMERAVDYIEYTLKNPRAADALLDEADTAINSLAHMPERYAPVDDQVLAALGIRFIQVKNYLAFYVVAKDTRTVHIVRFLYGKSDWASFLRKMKTDAVPK